VQNSNNLIVCNYLLVYEIVFAAMLKLAHNRRKNVSRSEHGYFGWGTLFKHSHWGFGRHGERESKQEHDEGENFGTCMDVITYDDTLEVGG
jgi:hypothetical protein